MFDNLRNNDVNILFKFLEVVNIGIGKSIEIIWE